MKVVPVRRGVIIYLTYEEAADLRGWLSASPESSLRRRLWEALMALKSKRPPADLAKEALK